MNRFRALSEATGISTALRRELEMPFLLPREYWQPLHKAVLARFPDEPEFRLWIEFNFTFKLATFKNGDHYPTVAFQFLEHLEKAGAWNELARAGIREAHLDSKCRELTRLIAIAVPIQPAAVSAAADGPFDLSRDDVNFLWDGNPFVDRESFWFDIEELFTSQQQRILVIHGPTDSGKSYCAEVLQYLLEQRCPGIRLARIELGDELPCDLPYDVELDEVCDVIQDKLKIPWFEQRPMFVPGEKPDRWARSLGRWFGKQLAAIGAPAWVIIDGLDNSDVRIEVRCFFSALATWTRDPDGDKLRVVFIDGNKAAGKLSPLTMRERPLHYLMAHEIGSYFNKLDSLHQVSQRDASLWQAAQEFINNFQAHTSGSVTQIESLSHVLRPIVKKMYRLIHQKSQS
jgi:hypothetical protein